MLSYLMMLDFFLATSTKQQRKLKANYKYCKRMNEAGKYSVLRLNVTGRRADHAAEPILERSQHLRVLHETRDLGDLERRLVRHHITCKKGSFYIAQYPVRRTAQSVLLSLTDLFIPTPTRLLRDRETF